MSPKATIVSTNEAGERRRRVVHVPLVFTDGSLIVVAESLEHAGRILGRPLVALSALPMRYVASEYGPTLLRAFQGLVARLAPGREGVEPGEGWRELRPYEYLHLEVNGERIAKTVQDWAIERGWGLLARLVDGRWVAE